MHVQLPGLMEEAATSLAESLGLPEPRQKTEIAKILDANTWVDTVLKPPDEAMHDETSTDTGGADGSMRDATRAAATMSDAEEDAETCADEEETSDNPDDSDTESDGSRPDWNEGS